MDRHLFTSTLPPFCSHSSKCIFLPVPSWPMRGQSLPCRGTSGRLSSRRRPVAEACSGKEASAALCSSLPLGCRGPGVSRRHPPPRVRTLRPSYEFAQGRPHQEVHTRKACGYLSLSLDQSPAVRWGAVPSVVRCRTGTGRASRGQALSGCLPVCLPARLVFDSLVLEFQNQTES